MFRSRLFAQYVATTMTGHIIRGPSGEALAAAAAAHNLTDSRWVTDLSKLNGAQLTTNAVPISVTLSSGETISFYNVGHLSGVPEHSSMNNNNSSNNHEGRPRTIVGGFFSRSNAAVLQSAQEQLGLPLAHWVSQEECDLLQWTLLPDAVPVSLPIHGQADNMNFYNIAHVQIALSAAVTAPQWFTTDLAQYGVTGSRYANRSSLTLLQFLSREPIPTEHLAEDAWLHSLSNAEERAMCAKFWGTESTLIRVAGGADPATKELVSEELSSIVPCSLLINGDMFQLYPVAKLKNEALRQNLWQQGLKNVVETTKKRNERFQKPAA